MLRLATRDEKAWMGVCVHVCVRTGVPCPFTEKRCEMMCVHNVLDQSRPQLHAVVVSAVVHEQYVKEDAERQRQADTVSSESWI